MLIKQAEQEEDKIAARVKKLFEETVRIITEKCTKNKSLVNEQIFKLDDEIHSFDVIAQTIEKKIYVTEYLDSFDQNTFIQMQEHVGNAQDAKRELDNLTRQLYRVELSFIPSKAISDCLNENKILGDVKEDLTHTRPMKDVGEIYFPLQPPATVTPKSSKTSTDMAQLSVKKQSSFSVKVPGDNKKCISSGMAVTDDGKLLVSDYNNKSVQLFTLDGKFLSSVTFDRGCNGISVATAITAIVSTRDNKLHFLDISDPSSISLLTSISLEYRVVGITTYNDKLTVTAFDQQSVKMINMAGQEVWSVSKGPDDQKLFQKPYDV